MAHDPNETPEELRNRFYRNLAWYFSEKKTPTGLHRTIGGMFEELGKLNSNLQASSASSATLSTALNRLTLAGVIVGEAGVLVAIAGLL